MNKNEWIRRCAARFEQRLGVPDKDSQYFAKVCLEYLEGDLTKNPEDAADDDMAYWQDY